MQEDGYIFVCVFVCAFSCSFEGPLLVCYPRYRAGKKLLTGLKLPVRVHFSFPTDVFDFCAPLFVFWRLPPQRGSLASWLSRRPPWHCKVLSQKPNGRQRPPPIQQAPGLSLGASSYCRSSPPTTRCSLPPGPPRPRRSTPAAPRGALACCPVLPSLPHHLSIPSLLSPPHASPPPPLPSRLLLKTVRTPRGIGGMGRAFPTPLSPLPHHIPYWFPHSLTGTRMALFTCLCLHPVNRQKRKTEHTVFS